MASERPLDTINFCFLATQKLGANGTCTCVKAQSSNQFMFRKSSAITWFNRISLGRVRNGLIRIMAFSLIVSRPFPPNILIAPEKWHRILVIYSVILF